jgi:nucleoside-diphosphate-sugar epimerase
MRVFVTGATGFVGSAVVSELLNAGHQVLGLVRSDAGVKSLTDQGAQAHRGDLEDPDSLKRGAAMCDAVIHTAFNHDFSKFKASTEMDRGVIQALASALVGTDRPLVITSAIGVLTAGPVPLTESDMPLSNTNPRTASEEAADAAVAAGVRAAVLRLPPSVHGTGDHGFVPILIDMARDKGVAVYKNQGLNCWPAVHRLDVARLYRLIVENDYLAGTRFHGVAEEGVLFKDIATAIGQGLDVPVASKTTEEAAAHFGWFAYFASLDCKASGKRTQEQLGWNPVQAGLIEDLHAGSYFKK